MSKRRKKNKIKIKVRVQHKKPRVPQTMMRNRRFEDKRNKAKERYFKKTLEEEGY